MSRAGITVLWAVFVARRKKIVAAEMKSLTEKFRRALKCGLTFSVSVRLPRMSAVI